jgi:hypothetical protein
MYSALDLVSMYPYTFILALTLNFGYIEMRLIVQRMCKEPCVFAYLLPQAPAIIALVLAPASDTALLIVALANALSFAYMANAVASQLCELLNIKVFSLGPRYPEQLLASADAPDRPRAEEQDE